MSSVNPRYSSDIMENYNGELLVLQQKFLVQTVNRYFAYLKKI